jgi:DNA-binding XRE family transcriptional regulator
MARCNLPTTRFGEVLKRFRYKAMLSQSTLAEMSGVSRACLNWLECGRVEPAWAQVLAIARALKQFPNNFVFDWGFTARI